jgi:hypothetical protein
METIFECTDNKEETREAEETREKLVFVSVVEQ